MAEETEVEQGISLTGTGMPATSEDLFEKDHLCTFALLCTKLHFESANQISDINPFLRISGPDRNLKILFALNLKKHTGKYQNKYRDQLLCA
ncbi:hypothetical protein [Methanolacinia paynteri]|uniref:hypothetical protein n=1 Tax=Methanolacinia paynteri TaxID=230356 RepID=UPI00064F3831|nr:hypothetical protein [Methanolacinia paynteri]